MAYNLRRITDGMIAPEAAEIIYGNDKTVLDMVNDIDFSHDPVSLDVRTVSDAGGEVELVEELGNSKSKVLSQRYTTELMEELEEEAEHVAMSGVRVTENVPTVSIVRPIVLPID
jgi:hypothetical protein